MHDSLYSSSTRKSYSEFLILCSSRRKHIWASWEQLRINGLSTMSVTAWLLRRLESPNQSTGIMGKCLYFLIPLCIYSSCVFWSTKPRV